MVHAATAGENPGTATSIESAIAEGLDAYRRNYPDALRIFTRLAPSMKKVKDKVLRAKVATYTGACHEGLGNFQEALDHYAVALRLSREEGHESNEAVILFNMGIVHNRTGRFAEALEIFLRALEIHERFGNNAKLWSVKTMLGRLLAKGVLAHEEDGRRYLYRPAVARERYVAGESRRLVDRLFGGRARLRCQR